MKQTLIGVLLCLLLAWGVWRQPPTTSETVQHREFFALGTLVQLSFSDPMPAGLMTQIQSALQDFETRWSVHGEGELALLNRELESHTKAPLPEGLRAGFAAAQQACQRSEGLFDPGIGSLVKLWGFDDEDHFRSTPPDATAIAQLNAARGHFCDAKLGDMLETARPGALFDFGASAKGRAVEMLITLLQANGIHNAIINAGGDLKALGQRPDRPWRIGIRHPRAEESAHDILASLTVHDGEAVFSSGDYERFFIQDGHRYHHIIDPRDGYPAQASQSATIVHSNAELADAAATALFVAGPEKAQEVMKNMQIEYWLLVDADGGIHGSSSMLERLEGLP